MNILHVIPSLKKGGAERLALDICRELQNGDSTNVLLLLLHDENEFSYLAESLNVDVTSSYFRYHLIGKPEAEFNDFRKLVEAFSPDVIHTHLFEAEFFTRHCLFPGVKYITHLHDNMAQFEGWNLGTLFSKARFTGWIEKRTLVKAYNQCDNTFIANSADTADYFRLRLPGALKNRITVLENAIDLSGFRFLVRPAPKNEIRLVSTGSFVKKKNHAFLIPVVSQLKLKGIKVQLTLLGDGPLRSMLQGSIAENGLQHEIIMPGNVDDVAHYLHQADLYVHPAIYEPFGLAIVEAMATGLPVVCLDGKGNRGLVDNGKNGFMLKEPDPALFAAKIMSIAGNAENYATFSLNAGTKARLYSIKEYAEKLVSIYQNPDSHF